MTQGLEMDIQTLRKAIDPPARIGIGLWVLPQKYLGKERDLAVRLDAGALDAREAYLKTLPVGSRFSGLTEPGKGAQRLFEAIYAICQAPQARACLLVHTLDLLLFGLSVSEREQFWKSGLAGIAYPKTRLILTIPEASFAPLVSPAAQAQFAGQIAEGELI